MHVWMESYHAGIQNQQNQEKREDWNRDAVILGRFFLFIQIHINNLLVPLSTIILENHLSFQNTCHDTRKSYSCISFS